MGVKMAGVGPESHLIPFRKPREAIKQGLTVMAEGQGADVFDQNGNRCIDLVAVRSRPVHVGYGRRGFKSTRAMKGPGPWVNASQSKSEI